VAGTDVGLGEAVAGTDVGLGEAVTVAVGLDAVGVQPIAITTMSANADRTIL
jgi:hypothetical protein